jgi:hypothetical protein
MNAVAQRMTPAHIAERNFVDIEPQRLLFSLAFELQNSILCSDFADAHIRGLAVEAGPLSTWRNRNAHSLGDHPADVVNQYSRVRAFDGESLNRDQWMRLVTACERGSVNYAARMRKVSAMESAQTYAAAAGIFQPLYDLALFKRPKNDAQDGNHGDANRASQQNRERSSPAPASAPLLAFVNLWR